MARRLQLQNLLEQTLGTEYVYFQPPATIKLRYPCAIYQLQTIPSFHADNNPYALMHRYEVILVTEDPDSPLVDKFAMLPRCSHNRRYVKDNLYHDVYSILY